MIRKSFFIAIFLCIVCILPAQLPNISLAPVVGTGLSSPVDLQNCGDERLFVVEQSGKIKIVSKTGTITAIPFLDISARVLSSGNEQGLLGLAFSPNYRQDGFFYVNYIYDNGTNAGVTRISRFSVYANDSTQADPNSEKIILSFNQPYTNHNGGALFFGLDGYLYDTQGDGGSQNDPNGNGQNTNSYLAKILRLDVSDPDTTYTIPPTNPFYGQPGKKGEVWAYGMRNPWRCNIDRITGDIWVADVGQNSYEEVDFLPAGVGGQNCGWKCREGAHDYLTTGCASSGFTDPVFEYTHSFQSSCSITGGYVYRGTQHSALWGKYICTDYCSGQFFSVKQTGANTFDPDTLNNLNNNQFTGFGQDNKGEMYVLYRGSGTGGRVYRLTETTNCQPVAFIAMQDTVNGCSPVTISALSGDTLSYQWYGTNGIINGATTYQLPVQQSGWYKVKVSKTLHAGCETMSDSVFVTINDTTAITSGTGNTVFCENSTPVALLPYLQPTGGVYSGSGVANNVFTPSQVNQSVSTVQYLFVNQFGCKSAATLQLQVNDTTTLTKNSFDSLFCVTGVPVSLNANYNYPGIYSGNGVANDDTTFAPASAGAGVATISFAYVNTDGCVSTSSFSVEVGNASALTVDSANRNTNTCEPPFSLQNYVVPTGGTYFGNAVANNMFNPQTGVANNKVYYEFMNEFGCISTDSFTIQVAICNGIEPVKDETIFSVFPNPAHQNFTANVSLSTAQPAMIIVTDVSGRICYHKNVQLLSGENKVLIDVSALNRGVYTVQLKTEVGLAAQQLLLK